MNATENSNETPVHKSETTEHRHEVGLFSATQIDNGSVFSPVHI